MSEYQGQPYVFLHIPKTGGTARATSLSDQKDKAWCPGHEYRQSMRRRDDSRLIVYVRHPVERFKSAWANNPDPKYRNANECALALEHDPPAHIVYRPATWWLNREPGDAWLFAVESMDWTWPRLMGTLGLDAKPLPKRGATGYNNGPAHPTLSEAAVEAINTYYMKDRAIWMQSIHRPRSGMS